MGTDSSSYTFNPGTGDAGSYKCVVSGTCTPNATATAGTLTVNTAPSANPVSPASQAVCAGSPVTFTVSAAGTGLHYQWQKAGGGNVGADSSSYTIASVASGDAGSYQCVVSGLCAPTATATAGALTVHAPPTAANSATTNAPNHALIFYTDKLAAQATAGDNSSLSVSAAGSGVHGNVVLDSGAGTVTFTPQTDYTGDGSFSYTITDGNGCTATATMTVTMVTSGGGSPNVVGDPIFDSGTGTFSVTFAGIPGVEYTVEYAEGSAAPPWTKLMNKTAGSNGLFEVTDGPNLSGSRYYRTVYPSY